jgi:hypothetical protein
MARTIVLVSSALAWALTLLLLAASGSPMALLIPVMGYCPIPNRSGDPGYDLHAAYVWGISSLVVFAALGVCAILRKSVPLAIVFAFALGMSVLIDLAHLSEAANTPIH